MDFTESLFNDHAHFARDYGWIIGTLSVIILYLINWYRRPKRFPPGPRGFPIVGYIPFIGQNAEKTINKLSKKYGKIFSVRMGSEDTVFLNDYDSIQTVSNAQINLKIVSIAKKRMKLWTTYSAKK